MRADQLGAALGARVHTNPYIDPPWADVERAEFVILVKRLKKRWNKWFTRLKERKIPIVWDCVDFWQQPEENDVGKDAVVKQFHRLKGNLGTRVWIVTTERMAADLGGYHLPHHHRVGLAAGPVRRTVSTVAYEGNARYLGPWREIVATAASRRGYTFVENPDSLTDADIVVALRGAEWDGWACRNWKSGVKYANAIAAGRPVITQATAAFGEIAPPGTVIEAPDELGAALDYWADYSRRLDAAHLCATLEPQYRIDAVAERYRQILTRPDVRAAIFGIKK